MPVIYNNSAIVSETDPQGLPDKTPMPALLKSLAIGLTAGLVLLILCMTAAPFLESRAQAPLILATMMVVALIHWWKNGIVQRINEIQGGTQRGLQRLSQQVTESQGLIQLVPYEKPYPLPFGGGWALTADAAALLAREVALQRPRTVVELGSGVSTLLLARLFKEMGCGKVFSLDHDPGWANITRRHLAASGVADYAEVLEAPLSRQCFGDTEYDWYTLPEAVRGLDHIDFLIVDGPPAALNPTGMPRYPALPAFIKQLSPQAIVYVDDAKRPQEQAMIERWLQEHPGFEGRLHDTVPGTYLIRRNC